MQNYIPTFQPSIKAITLIATQNNGDIWTNSF